MALRKEEFHYDPNEKKPMDKAKSSERSITIDISTELGARIAAAAQQQRLSINQYLESLLSEAVPVQAEMKHVRRPITLNDVEKLMQVRDQILREHGGVPFENSVEMLHQEREEREKELGF